MSSETEDVSQCYNKGCLKQYTYEEDVYGACVYHPGLPVFHDAMKGWSCCEKRSTDFTDFLNIPGCTVGNHNPIKPVEPERVKEKPLAVGEQIIVKAALPRRKADRPPDDQPMVTLKVKVTNSLKSLLARLSKQQQQQQQQQQSETEKLSQQDSQSGAEKVVEIGAACKNKGCNEVYYGAEVALTRCRYHPGVPIFHEGCKFWTCCQRMTSDFGEFIKQEGCTPGDHKWIETEKKKGVSCRYDWHQTGTQVIVAFYAKACVPEQCLFEANQTSCCVQLCFNNGKDHELKELTFYGVIDVDQSSVELLGTKAEMKLKKVDPVPWVRLEHTKPHPPAESNPSNNNDDDQENRKN